MLKNIVSFLFVFIVFGNIYGQLVDSIAGVKHLVILQTNDHHGHPFPFDYYFMKNVGGLPARATLVNKIRSENKHVIVLDAGDLNSGLIASDYFNAEPDIKGYNYMAYDAMVVGNHEFDNEIDTLIKQSEQANFPFISANIKIKKHKDLFKPYIIKEIDGVSVAILGLTTEETKTIGNPETMSKVKVRSEIRTAKRYVPKLDKKADIIVALSHLGWYGESDRGAYRLAREVDNIDLVIDGHTHTKMDSAIIVRHKKEDHNTIITQAWCNGLVLGRIDLWLKGDGIYKYSFELLPVNLQKKTKIAGKDTVVYVQEKLKDDPALCETLQPYKDVIDSLFKVPVVRIDSSIDFKTVNKTYNIKSVISESMRWYTKDNGVDLSVFNMGCIRNILPKGEVSLENIYSVLPFDNTLCIISLKGSDLEDLIRRSLGAIEKKGAYPVFSDNINIELSNDGIEIRNITINSTRLNKEKIYKVVTTSYLAKGGDNYPIPDKRSVVDLSIYQRDVLYKFLKEKYYQK